MKVRDVMTVGVVSVAPDTPVKEIAALLIGAKVSGLPVVDGGRLMGIVSESDILPIREGIPGRPVKTAADVMNPKVISLVEDMTITAAARVLQRHRIKRAPVTRGERVVGIVTRSDLLRPYLRTDSELLAEVEDAILQKALGLSPRTVLVHVEDGVVTLDGELPDERTRAIVIRLVRGVDGVVDVVDELRAQAPAVPA